MDNATELKRRYAAFRPADWDGDDPDELIEDAIARCEELEATLKELQENGPAAVYFAQWKAAEVVIEQLEKDIDQFWQDQAGESI